MVGVLLRISERALGGLRGNVNHVSLLPKSSLCRGTRGFETLSAVFTNLKAITV